MTAEDNVVLNNLDDVADFLSVTSDSGTSLQAASLAAGLRQGDVNALVTLFENIGTGRVLTNSIFQRIMLGTGVQRKPFAELRAMGAILSLELTDFSTANEAENQPPPK